MVSLRPDYRPRPSSIAMTSIMQRTRDGAVLTKVNSLHAQSVGHYVRGGIVGKAGMFVLLRALLVGNDHALAGKFAAAHLAYAGNDVLQGIVRILANELSAVVVCSRRPCVHHLPQVEEKKIRRDGKIGCPPLGIGAGGVVLDGSVTRPVVVEVLAPEQELNGVPASGDVLFAALLVERNQERRVDYGERFRVVDDTGLRIPLSRCFRTLPAGYSSSNHRS